MLSRSSIVGRRVLRSAVREFPKLQIQAVQYSSKKGFEKFYKPPVKKGPQSDKKEPEVPKEVPLDAAQNKENLEQLKSQSKIIEEAAAKAAADKVKAALEAAAEEEAKKAKLEAKEAKEDESEKTKAKVEAKADKSKEDDGKKNMFKDKKDEEDDDEESTDKTSLFVLAAMLAISSFVLFKTLRGGDDARDMSGDIDWEGFRRLLANNEIAQVKILNNKLAVVVMGGNRGHSMPIASGHAFEKQLEMTQIELGVPAEDHVPVTYEQTHRGVLVDVIVSCLPAMFIFWALKNSGAQLGGMFTKKKFAWSSAKKVTTTFEDVAGLKEAKNEIIELVDFLKDPKKYEELGAKIPKGCLLTGPPGVGKTLLAKATAGEAAVPFLSISGSDFVEIFVGVGPSRVRDMFKEARKKAPCIIFIDEIDAIGRSRKGGGRGGRNDERESTLNALLVEMDGFNTSAGVVVLAGTNRPDVLDKALLRPGRFDRQINLDNPALEDRVQIWMVHLKNITTNPDVAKEELAKGLATLSAGFSGADIMNACNEAALTAARMSADVIEMIHFEKALDRIVGGLEKKNKVLSQWERKVVAHHEAGHAIVGWFSEWVDPLLKVSIQPRANGTLGFAQYLPKDKYIKTWRQIYEEMSMALGGRAAEKIIFDHLSSGASDDLQRVTKMAYAQVTRYGMSDEIGHVNFPTADDADSQFNKFYSKATEVKIDKAVHKLVNEAYERTEKLLIEKKAELLLVAQALLEKEVLKTEDMVELLGERPYGMPDIYVAKKLKEKEAAEAAKKDADVDEDGPATGIPATPVPTP